MNPDFFKRLLRAIGLAPPEDLNTPETAFEMEPMYADLPAGYVEDKYGFDMSHPLVQQLVASPFVQDTVQAILGTIPTYGAATRNVPMGIGGFVPRDQPSRAHIVPIGRYASEGGLDMEPYGETLLHEGFHVRDLMGDEDVLALKEQLLPFYETLLMRSAGNLEQGEQPPWIALMGAANPEEHLGYAAEGALQWLRSGRNSDVLEEMESLVPGTKIVAEFMDRRLRESENGDQRK